LRGELVCYSNKKVDSFQHFYLLNFSYTISSFPLVYFREIFLLTQNFLAWQYWIDAR
jgi:hypothetical protein